MSNEKLNQFLTQSLSESVTEIVMPRERRVFATTTTAQTGCSDQSPEGLGHGQSRHYYRSWMSGE